MDRRGNGLLKVIPKFGGSKVHDSSQLSSKDKRYYQQVEKVLLTFESLEEWADYIAFLSKLQKALQLLEADGGNVTRHSVEWIPHNADIANKLSLCLSSKLPNGVHQKALNLYELIFNSLTLDTFNNELFIWIPGLLPVLSFGSIQVKSEMVRMFKYLILTNIHQKNLYTITKPLILSLLSGLDDENSESFPDIFQLLDDLKLKLNNDNHFWQNLFLAIISNPEKRLGALYWCNKRLPTFTTFKTDSGEYKYSNEAIACLKPNPGLLTRAFASAISTKTNFNPANDIIIIRGFFDLMISHLPLNCDIFDSAPKDKQLLMKSSILLLLKKDMSLNRRLWSWLLGPESDSIPHLTQGSSDQGRNSMDAARNATELRADFFETNGLETLTTVLFDLIERGNVDDKTNGFKMSLSLIIDKWEISHRLIPRLLSPILKTCYTQQLLTKSEELLASGQAFFNGVESSYIWSHLITLISSASQEDNKLLNFVLMNFDFNEDDMKLTHIPLGLLTCMLYYKPDNLNHSFIDLMTNLMEIMSPAALESIDKIDIEPSAEDTVQGNIEKVNDYYKRLLVDDSAKTPYSKQELTNLIYQSFKVLLVSEFRNFYYSNRLANLFSKLIYLMPSASDFKFRDDGILQMISNQEETNDLTNTEQINNNLVIAFSITKIFNLMAGKLSIAERVKIIKVITTNIWPSLISTDPNGYKVESVKCLFDLDINCPNFYIEAAISNLILKSNNNDRVRGLLTLWSHSNSQQSDLILERPLQLILDDLMDEGNSNSNKLLVQDFIRNILKNGHSNRLLKMITNPLLDFEFMHLDRTELEINDELSKFAYYLKTILNVINTNNKVLREAFNNEFAVMDNSFKLKIIKTNEWDISTYKSLIFYIIEKFLSLKLSDEFLNDTNILKDYYNSVNNSLELFSLLITGNEIDFNDKFHRLIENCSYYISLPNIPYQLELVECQYLKCIFNQLKLSEDAKINLNLLHIEDEGREPLLVKFLINGINKSQTSILLEEWMALLTRSLYLFNESVFSVLSVLNSAIIDKVTAYFDKIRNNESVNNLVDIEASVNVLISGIEDLLSISHSYLLTSKFRNKSDIKSYNHDNYNFNYNNGNTANNANNSSFLGNVIQGVFQIESPAIRTTEQNKLYSILLAFQDAIKIGFKIWNWSDIKPDFNTRNNRRDSKTNVLLENSEKSKIYLANKLRFRSKKLLESLMDLERQEVIENLIDIDRQFKSLIKILNVLDGGRSQITLPHILNSITTRCYPTLLPDPKKSYLNVSVNEKEISKFLVDYLKSIDNDTVTDIWGLTVQFFKDVLSHYNHFKPLIPSFLRIIKNLSLKLTSSKFGEERKHKRELSDLFAKLLTSFASGKRILFSSSDTTSEQQPEEKATSDTESTYNDNEDPMTVSTPTPQGVQEELIETLAEIVESFDDILEDSDKVSNCVNVIIFNLITPQIKSKAINEIPIRILNLLKLIGQHCPNRSWKTLIGDLFNDNNFFSVSANRLEVWKKIISVWVSLDSDRIVELMTKVSSTSSTSPQNLFLWNEKSELESKIYAMKRMSFLILVQPNDFWLSYLDEIFDKVGVSLMSSVPPAFKIQICILFRAITLKFNDIHLLPRWTIITQELISIFGLIIDKSLKELNNLSAEELQLILNGCKLLDQLLLLSNDEFNLNEWLFIKSNFDISYDTSSNNDLLISIVDKFVKETDLTLLKELPYKINQPSSDLVPLLNGISSISSIANLRTFFESLSYLNYERIYGLYELDIRACEVDVTDDLFT